MVQMDASALTAFLAREFPQALAIGLEVASVDERGVDVAWLADERHLRPGGTVSGPTLFTLVDTAAYLVILSRLGPVALAVTTSTDIHFLRKAPPGRLVARASLLRLGRRIAVAQAEVLSGDDPDPVAVATVSYAIP